MRLVTSASCICQECPQAFLQVVFVARLALPDDKALPATRPLAIQYSFSLASCSVRALAPSMSDSISEHGRFCSCVNARNTREQKSLSGAAQRPGRVFREDPSDAAGTGSPICARDFAPSARAAFLASDRPHIGASIHQRSSGDTEVLSKAREIPDCRNPVIC